MAEATEEQQLPDMFEEAELGLKSIATVEKSGSPRGPLEDDDGGSSENGGQLDKNGDLGAFRDDGISDILRFDENTYQKDEPSHVEAGETSGVAGEVVEEEIVELEFEKVKPKLATHSMHCPHCKSEITKVVLRRKVITSRRPEPPVAEPQRDPDDLVGCLSCLSLFTCSGNGCFNPFDIFRKKSDPTNVLPPQSTVDGTAPVVTETENCFSMFLVFKKKQKVTETADTPQTQNVDRDFIISDQPKAPKYVTGTGSIAKGQHTTVSPLPSSPVIIEDNETTYVVDSNKAKKGLLGGHRIPSPDHLPPSSSAPVDHDTTIDVGPEPETDVVTDVPVTGRTWLGYEGILAEILKSIVYGGLMEVIASLSIVASAAASDTATLNIIALAVASLVGGIIILWNNIWDLRKDCYKGNPSQQTEEGEAINKYKELFGRVNFFPLHTFFAVLSFIIFGMIPPVTYGFSFHKSNDRDYTMAAVAIASLLCVALLSLFKAFINKCGVMEYFKTVVFYITTAVSASGVSYVAGNLVTRFVKELGLFDMSSGGGMSLLTQATNPSLSSF
ncbi:hypothetical protein L2E82_20269 [Cichorium intybus]|uniref:Uncharacterized protein n=1 Tax=Cichorium intybus TaxID=13427 RepID=A0ACB9DT49_CICIN|nr:hypothetical protein L2E82_20269 [Cichorium intybus]